MNELPLVRRDATERIARWNQTDITTAQFCADVATVAQALPDAQHIINLCQDRYRFVTTFFAALSRGQTNLLPAKRDHEGCKALQTSYTDTALVSDEAGTQADAHIAFAPGENGKRNVPTCSADLVAAIAFTSGSTGEPQAHAKRFSMLDTWRQVHARYLRLAQQTPAAVVATVPCWHMYGLEWAMLLPTVAPVQLYCGADFYPKDVVRAINQFNGPVILVSTPLHLRALSKIAAPDNSSPCTISATAPLDAQLTQTIEAHLRTQVFEIYGCSEIGSLAYRFPSSGSAWTFFDCFELEENTGVVRVDHSELSAPIELADQFESVGENRFNLLGRMSDIVKVAGKRESLAHLNAILTNMDGVEDGVIYDPANYNQPDTGRLAALVVAPNLDSISLRAALAKKMDAAFLPRPIRKVASLPRNSTSKLKHSELAELISQVNQDG